MDLPMPTICANKAGGTLFVVGAPPHTRGRVNQQVPWRSCRRMGALSWITEKDILVVSLGHSPKHEDTVRQLLQKDFPDLETFCFQAPGAGAAEHTPPGWCHRLRRVPPRRLWEGEPEGRHAWLVAPARAISRQGPPLVRVPRHCHRGTMPGVHVGAVAFCGHLVRWAGG